MPTVPQQEHQWLQQLVGEWTYVADVTMEPGKSPETFNGTESVRSLGGLWILAEGQGEMLGCGVATTLLTLGYDPQKQRYVGTWIGSMMTHLWVYDGAMDAAGRLLTLDAERLAQLLRTTPGRAASVLEAARRGMRDRPRRST